MFEHFTFGATSLSHNHDISASPTDVSFPPPATAYPFYDEKISELGDFVHQFGRQSLEKEDVGMNSFAPWDEATSSRSEVDDEMPYLTPCISAPTQRSPGTSSIACRRLQRQINTQMQLSSSHTRDLQILMQDMIESSSQCTLYAPTSKLLAADPNDVGHSHPALEVDEGFSEPSEAGTDEETTLRRASSPSGIRKFNGIKYARSGSTRGACRVKSVTRMRKRKTTTTTPPLRD